MKTYRRHNCERRHRTWSTFAQCIWPRAVWIAGDGPYACVAYCRQTTVMLHRTAVAAAEAKRTIDSDACGGRCWNNHEIIRLESTIEAVFADA
jgi:hypothetical protein